MSNQAAWLDTKGSPLRIGDAETPKPASNEVVIKNHALAINPVDWKQQDYGYFIKEFPVILGCDVAGEITEVGSGVSKFKVGDRVIGHAISLATASHKHAGFQLFTTLPTERVAKIPSSISFEEGSVLPLAVSTAADGLYKPKSDGFLGLAYPSAEGSESTGKVIVVYGGSSSVGALTIQLAVASGVKVVALASQKNFQFVKDAGASEVFDYKDSEVVEKVINATKKLGEFAGVYDAIALPDQSYHITVPIAKELGGNVATVLPPPENLPAGVKAGNVFACNESTDPVWNDYLEAALASGKLKPIPAPLVVGTGLKDVQKGLDKNKEGVSAKKVVVKL